MRIRNPGAMLIGLCVASGCSADFPMRASRAPAFTSIRYVRTKPVVDSSKSVVTVFMQGKNPDCYGCNGSSGLSQGFGVLTATAPDVFEYSGTPNIGSFAPDDDVLVFVNDSAVSSNAVAHDIYVNGTKVAASDGPIELGHFRERSDGTIY